MTAKFKVIKIDPEGSGMDWGGHLGATLTDAKRCCENCCIIFGTVGSTTGFGPFVPGELAPLNDEAKKVQSEISFFLAKAAAEIEFRRKHPRRIVYAPQFLESYEKLVGHPHPSTLPETIKVPKFGPKKGSS